MSPQERGAQWQALATPEDVVAAHEAGRSVWNRSGKRRKWHEVSCRGAENIRAFIAMGWEYRAKATGKQP